MDQSKSSSKLSPTSESSPPPLQKRVITVELLVGAFTLLCCAAIAWLAVGLGGIALFGSGGYQIYAEFDNISGLKEGASLEIAGVQVGSVTDIALKDPYARITLTVREEVPIYEDDIAAIRTKGIIGDRYVKISRGGSDAALAAGDTIVETESIVDIEDLIGKIVHSMTEGDDE